MVHHYVVSEYIVQERYVYVTFVPYVPVKELYIMLTCVVETNALLQIQRQRGLRVNKGLKRGTTFGRSNCRTQVSYL